MEKKMLNGDVLCGSKLIWIFDSSPDTAIFSSFLSDGLESKPKEAHEDLLIIGSIFRVIISWMSHNHFQQLQLYKYIEIIIYKYINIPTWFKNKQ